ncbi:hypothetical protein ABZ092_36050 [Streptomyces bobili]
MTPKFRVSDHNVRDSRRKDKTTTLHRREVRRQKYEASPAAVRVETGV